MTTWTLAPCLAVLRRQLNTAHPDRSIESDGTIGDAAHAATVSDHNPDALGAVRAFDVTHDPAHGVDGTALANALAASRDPRVKYLIWNRRMLRTYPHPGTTPWTWAPYTGSDPHTNHVHLSVVADTRANNTQPWTITTLEDDMFTDKDRETLDYLPKQVKDTAERVNRANASIAILTASNAALTASVKVLAERSANVTPDQVEEAIREAVAGLTITLSASDVPPAP